MPAPDAFAVALDEAREHLRKAIAERNAALSEIDDLNQDCADLEGIIISLSELLGVPVDASIVAKQSSGRPKGKKR